MKKALLLALLFTVSSSSFAVSVDQNLLNKAKSGDRASQEEVAKFYRFSGEEGESLSWLYKAYENGSGYAAGKIAKAYYDGEMGLQRDRSEAWSWYRKGAELNDKTSLIFMADDYAKETVKQYRDSSGYSPKYSDSYQLELQRKEERQERARKEQALKYLVQCINELKDAECNIRYAKLRRTLYGNLDESAFKAVQRAAEKGYLEAFTELAFYYENGYIVKEEPSKAYEYLQYTASKNEKNALEKLGEAYLQAHKYNLAKDEKKGINYLEKAGALGNGDAYRTLGDYYFTDKNNAVDLNRAIGYYEKGVALGNPYTAWNLAALYSAHDEKLEKSRSYYTKEMAKLMALAADGGLLEAQLALASAHEKGQFGLHSRSKAKYYYELAAKQGSGEAKLKLKGFN
ncbi:hypothetical protein [Psychrobacter piscatorii]|uniref:tetratricopeptide repeat protein n=1 Tax=Psychrobacter piscatorii TaxID=554343 RepID=UPI003736F111